MLAFYGFLLSRVSLLSFSFAGSGGFLVSLTLAGPYVPDIHAPLLAAHHGKASVSVRHMGQKTSVLPASFKDAGDGNPIPGGEVSLTGPACSVSEKLSYCSFFMRFFVISTMPAPATRRPPTT